MNTATLWATLASITLISTTAMAFPFNGKSQTTLKTVMTCQQLNSDQWVEVGIVRNQGYQLQAYVISHDANRGTSKLIAEVQVSEIYRGQARVYHDRVGSFRLLTMRNPDGTAGEVIFQKKGLKTISEKSLVCEYDNTITFDQN